MINTKALAEEEANFCVLVKTRPISVSCLICTSGEEYHIQAGSTSQITSVMIFSVNCIRRFQVSGSGESDILWHIDDADISSINALFAFKMCCHAATVAKLSTMCQRKNSTAKLIFQDPHNLNRLARLKI